MTIDIPVTNAVRFLRDKGIAFEPHFYDYVEKGGTAVSSRALGFDEHLVIKTLIMEDESKKPIIVLMHGDRTVSTKNLARELGVKTVRPCEPSTADRHSATWWEGLHRLPPVKLCPSSCKKVSQI